MKGILLVPLFMVGCLGHGRLMNPPSRASQWRFGFDNPPDYDDNQGFCGGKTHQNEEMGGKCGVCGDPYDGPWPHQAPGGVFANGNIVAEYSEGSKIEVAVQLTTNHRGFFTFRLCPNNNVNQDPTQECFDQYVLENGGGSTRYPVVTWDLGYWNTTVHLPAGLVCEQCILQWTYTAGNDWGTCENGTQAVGCGPQETFRACADIAITPVKLFDLNEFKPVPEVIPTVMKQDEVKPAEAVNEKRRLAEAGRRQQVLEQKRPIHPKLARITPFY